MGLENELLPDSRITASSFLSEIRSPSSVRLSSDTSWSPSTVDEPQFLQVDLESPRNISAVFTKGDAKLPQWVTSFQVAYSSDEDNWIPVTNEKGEAIEFPANIDNESPVTSLFPETFEAQYLRIIPTDWKNWISLRAEILGCYHPYEPFVEVTAPPEEVLSLTVLPTEPIMAVACPNPMEAEETLLVGARIQASSFAPNSSPSRIPLNTIGENGLSGGWVP
ncbi:Lactadherin, partial [Stegodyphus mimosarum]